MSKLRPECVSSNTHPLSNETALYLIRDSVAKRRVLIYGHLSDGEGRHCAMGAFWADHPGYCVNDSIVDEVSAVNDSIPPTDTPQKRWNKVNDWLRWKLRVLSQRKKS